MKEARRPTPEIGMRMKELRESIGISQAVLAERINATQSSVNRYENGQSPPPLDYLRRFADFFDVSLDYIFCRTSPKERPMTLIQLLHRTKKTCVDLSRCALTLLHQ